MFSDRSRGERIRLARIHGKSLRRVRKLLLGDIAHTRKGDLQSRTDFAKKKTTYALVPPWLPTDQADNRQAAARLASCYTEH